MSKAVKTNDEPVKTESLQVPRIYFAYTPHYNTVVFEPSRSKGYKEVRADRAVIALRRVDDKLIYGVSICTVGDVWDKVKGRQLAERRMNQKFATTTIDFESPVVKAIKENRGDHQVTMFYLRNITESVSKKIVKYKRKIEKFNAQYREEAVSTLDTLVEKAAMQQRKANKRLKSAPSKAAKKKVMPKAR